MRLNELIKRLVSKRLDMKDDPEVEFIIVTNKGKIIAMDLGLTSIDMQKVLSLFPKNKEEQQP